MPAKANSSAQESTEFQLPKNGHIRAFKAAPALGISSATMYRWVNQGKLPKLIKLSDRISVFDAAELHAWINRQRGEVV